MAVLNMLLSLGIWQAGSTGTASNKVHAEPLWVSEAHAGKKAAPSLDVGATRKTDSERRDGSRAQGKGAGQLVISVAEEALDTSGEEQSRDEERPPKTVLPGACLTVGLSHRMQQFQRQMPGCAGAILDNPLLADRGTAFQYVVEAQG